MSKRKRRFFSREFKLSAVQRMLAGESTKALSRELGVPVDRLDRWCQQYRLGGAEGLRKAGRPRKPAGAGLDPLAKVRRTKGLGAAPKYISELECTVWPQQL